MDKPIDEIIKKARTLLVEVNEKYDKANAVDMDTPEAVTLWDDYKYTNHELKELPGNSND